jgi:hypothetical protein
MARRAAAPVKRIRVTAAHIAQQRESAKKDHSPKWDNADSMSSVEFANAFHYAMQYYNLECATKDLKAEVLQWMKAENCDPTIISAFKRTADWRCSSTMGAIAACILRGMPPQRDDFNNGRHNGQWLLSQIHEVIEQGKRDYDADTKVSTPIDIHSRVIEASGKMVQDFDEAIDNWSKDPSSIVKAPIDPLAILKQQGAKAVHAKVIKDFYLPVINELHELLNGTADDQLLEGYSTKSIADIKVLHTFYMAIVAACDMLAEVGKTERKPRAKKPIQKETLVKQLKFKKTDDQLKLVSISPIAIIGAKELWCYDTKTRKLGKYIALDESMLSVKGTSIVGYDESRSIQKTLRNPLEQLTTFKSLGKIALRKYLDDINSVDIKLSGRINENVILLKVT